jgi:branched-chain amino acid transport system substrate-binding protein
LAQTVEVALPVPLTGPLAALGQEIRQGAQAAVEEINRRGGVRGQRLDLRVEDDGCDPARAASIAQLLAARKVAAVIGHACSAASLAAAPIYAQGGVLMITPAAGAPQLTVLGGSRNVFRVVARDDIQGQIAGVYLRKRFPDGRIALVRDQSSYGAALAEGVKLGLTTGGRMPTFEITLTGDYTEVMSLVDQLKASTPTVVFVAATALNAAMIIKRGREVGLDAAFVAGDAASSQLFSSTAGRAKEGVLSTSLVDPRPLPSAAQAAASIRERGFDPAGRTLYAYAAVQVVAQAIERAGATDFATLEPVLHSQSFATAIGDVRFDPAGDLTPIPIEFSQWREERYVSIDARPYWDRERDANQLLKGISLPASVVLPESPTPLTPTQTSRPPLAPTPGQTAQPPSPPEAAPIVPGPGGPPQQGVRVDEPASQQASRPASQPEATPPRGPQPQGEQDVDQRPTSPGARKSKKARKKSKGGGGGGGGGRHYRRIASPAVQGVHWNTYFTRGDDRDARLNVQARSSYTLVLDLSAYNYRQVTATNAAGTQVSPDVEEALRTAPQEPVELKIRPITVTPNIRIEDTPVKAMRVDRRKLIRPQDGRAAEKEDELVARFQRKAIKVADFSDTVAAGKVSFQVSVTRDATPGCAVIAFTIWDFRDNPIDHLLQTVPLDGGPARTDCDPPDAEALKGGFATLLSPDYAIGPGTDPARPIQAALLLFETLVGDEKKSFVILVDKTKAGPAQPRRERGVYSWRLGHWLSEYISAADKFPFQIKAAWDKAYNNDPAAYALAADELSAKIFGAETDQPAADAARAALQNLAATQASPLVVARLIGANNQKLYLPLSVLAAAGNRRGLSKPITVLQPLKEERYGGRQCIRAWSFGISPDTESLDQRTKAALQALAAEPPQDGETWVTTTDALEKYAAKGASGAGAEGLVLLAHHDGEGVYFNQRDHRITSGGFLRTFAPGSIALLASCSTSTPASDMALLNALNHNGMDAMIVSPFKVRLDYGAQLALQFTNVVRKHRSNRATPTLAQMFSEASAATTAFFADPNRRQRLEGMALEFVLVGDPYVRLCAP